LNSIGNNFNQAVKKLHTLKQIPEVESWLKSYEEDRIKLMQKTEEIKAKINEIFDQWLQK
jgi:hypothetical protein